jgi:hypothetical protein
MSGAKQGNKNAQQVTKTNSKTSILIGLAVVLILGFFVFKAFSSGGEKTTASAGSDLVIPKSEISQTAKFYSYKVGKTAMEVIALKASDGTIRTALNTCQVCNGSPKAYYEQQGDVLVCQNCGNQFKADMVEKERGGCNPVPIMKENKTEDENNITISKAFLEANIDLFKVWKKQ